MPLVNVPFNQAAEQEPVPEGTYDLRVQRFERRTSKAGNDMYSAMLVIEDPNYPNAAPVNEFFILPKPCDPGDSEQTRKNATNLRKLWRFLEAFGISYEQTGFNDEEVEGATGRCLLGQQEDTESGEIRNTLRLPRVGRAPR